VKKGLKKSYYTVQENLNSRVKGKILVGDQIKHNLLKNRLTKTICQFQEFGFDTEVNQFLKYVLSVVPNLLADFNKDKQFNQLQEVLNYCKGGFYQVNNKVFKKIKHRENNPFYRNYNQAIQLGNQILALQDYNISSQNQQETTIHPRFWIDMSKLFELYVFNQLKEKYPKNGEVQYHKKFNKQEPDFILNTNCGIKAVLDAKYKPRYKNGNPTMDDARQLSGYTRLNSVYKELGLKDDNRVIPAYFIYPANLSLIDEKENNSGDPFEDAVLISTTAILATDCRKSTSYKEMYLQEVKLPFLVAVSKEKVISAN
jgi:5-methylcytosine-specific restriction enzyme subunit McrC